jgi:four helix bundle protein
MDSTELKVRTKRFAHECVKIASELANTQLGRHISGQLNRCSTSVAANYRATCHAQSKAAFIAKISIVVEECDESEFWLEFIMDENLLSRERIQNHFKEAHELASIFVKSRRTAQGR